NHVRASAHQRLQRLGAAVEVRDLDLEALVPEIAVALRDRERQVVEEVLPPDGDRDLLLLRRLREARAHHGHPQQQRERCLHESFHHPLLLLSLSTTAGPHSCRRRDHRFPAPARRRRDDSAAYVRRFSGSSCSSSVRPAFITCPGVSWPTTT